MIEKDLQIYDVWQSDNGNLFIKLTDEYSIEIGAKGYHQPRKWQLGVTQYIKADDTTEVKRIGKIVFDSVQDINTLTKYDWNCMHDCVLQATWDGTPEGELKRTYLNNEQLRVLFDTLPDDIKIYAYEWGMNGTEWRENFIKYYKKNCL